MWPEVSTATGIQAMRFEEIIASGVFSTPVAESFVADFITQETKCDAVWWVYGSKYWQGEGGREHQSNDAEATRR